MRLEEEVVRLPSGRRRCLGAHGHDRLAVEVDRTRQVVEAAEALEDAHAVPGAAQQRGRRLTNGPVADYGHVVLELAHYRAPPSTRLERTLQVHFCNVKSNPYHSAVAF